MKKLLPAVIFLIFTDCQIAFSQQVDFVNGYAGRLNRFYATINDMEFTSDSSILLTGTAWYPNGPDEYFIIKADLEGNVEKIIRDDSTGSGVGEGQIIKEVSNGNYLMVDFRRLQGSSVCPKLMFYDSSGNFLFQKVPYAASPDTVFQPAGLVEIQSSLYLIGQVYSSSNAYSNGIVVKTDLEGNFLQLNWLPDTFITQFHGGVLASHGNILIGGFSSDSIALDRKPQLTCIDTSGLVLWQQTYNIGSHYFGVDEVCEVPGGYLLGVNSIWLMKVDTAGNLIWDVPQSFLGQQMQINYSGNYLLTGQSGTVKWCDTLGMSFADYSVGVAGLEAVETIIWNNKIYIAGRSYVGSGYEGILVRISDSLLTQIGDINFPNSKIYPNPVCSGTRLYLSGSIEKITSVTLHDMEGNLLFPARVMHADTTPFIDIPQSLRAGTYLITINNTLTKSIYRLVVVN